MRNKTDDVSRKSVHARDQLCLRRTEPSIKEELSAITPKEVAEFSFPAFRDSASVARKVIEETNGTEKNLTVMLAGARLLSVNAGGFSRVATAIWKQEAVQLKQTQRPKRYRRGVKK